MDRRYRLLGYDGSVSFYGVVWLELVFLRRTYRGRFLLVDRQYGILGRNVLNTLSIVLDGPQQTWAEQLQT